MITVAVCVKQIPNPNSEPSFDLSTNTLQRSGPLVLDEADSFAVEMALRLVDEAGGGEVVALSIAPDDETGGIRSAYALGADRAILVSDPALLGTDALGTAKVLAALVGRVQPDLVLAATESTDGYTGTVPVQLAELLGLPAVTHAREITFEPDRVQVRRRTDEGSDEISCPLPAVVSLPNGVVEVRYPPFRAKLAAKSKPVEQLTLADLGLEPEQVGWRGARQEIIQIDGGEPAPSSGPGGSLFAAVFGAVESGKDGVIITDEGDGEMHILQALQSWNAV